MLIIKGVNLYPSEVEATLLAVEELQPHYLLVVDRSTTLARLEVQVEPTPAMLERCGGFQPTHPALSELRHRVSERLHRASWPHRRADDRGAPHHPALGRQGGARRRTRRREALSGAVS